MFYLHISWKSQKTFFLVFLTLSECIEREYLGKMGNHAKCSNFWTPSPFCHKNCIKCRGNYMKIDFASAFPRQCFCPGWQDYILRASVFTSATSAKTSTRSKLVRLLPLLLISPRMSCRNFVVQILLYAMQCALFSCPKLFF